MPAGLPYFAWVEASETTFEEAHLRWDENVFSFTLEQSEGDPANLTVVVRRPRNLAGDPIGLLGPGRKIWAWFALDCGVAELFKFRGRLVGVPTSIFEELVTLEFVARPHNVVAQKETLAETLRVLPYYDEVVLDPSRRTDPEVVLEGYTKIWHYDRETHDLTVSDEITGEDGLVEFDGASEAGKVLYDGLGLTLTSGPLSRVDVIAEYEWTQQAYGSVDLTGYVVGNWGSESVGNVITSYTLTADDWPMNGTSLGPGWEATDSTAREKYDLTPKQKTWNNTVIVEWIGETTTVNHSGSVSELVPLPPGSLVLPALITSDTWNTTYDGGEATSFNRNTTITQSVVVKHHLETTLGAAYTAARPCTEIVTFSLYADVQHILTDPEDGEALRLDDINSVNLSEPIGEGTDAYVPMVDSRRRSYIATARGNQSLQHLIALAQAHLMKRARVVEIAFEPKLERMPEITLRKNVFLLEPRIGEAVGKVISYSIAMDGADGRINCEVRIGCTIGRGGSAIAAGGTPTYCEEAYTGADYQHFTGRIVLFDSSVGYEPPNAAPNDDGIELLSVLRAQDVIEGEFEVENPAPLQLARMREITELPDLSYGSPAPGEDRFQLVAERNEAVNNLLKATMTRATFRLKNMNGDFTTNYQLGITDLKIPTGYNLEAV